MEKAIFNEEQYEKLREEYDTYPFITTDDMETFFRKIYTEGDKDVKECIRDLRDRLTNIINNE